MKRTIFSTIIIILFICIILISFSDISPDANIIINISGISEKQYKNLKTNYLYDRENLKELYIKVNITNNFFAYKTTINFPEIIELYKDGDNKVVKGEGYKGKTEIERYIIYDSSNLSEAEVRSMLKSYKISIEWKALINRSGEREFNLIDTRWK